MARTFSIRSHITARLHSCPVTWYAGGMNDLSQLFQAIDQGDPLAASQLLPLVYDELRHLAAQKLAQEKPGQTLQATALVHEAYLRLVGNQQFANRRHFFAAAAEAMRRILVENARRKRSDKRGGGWQRVDFPEDGLALNCPVEEVLAVDEALDQFAQEEPQTAELVKLHFFAGLTLEEAAELLELPARTAYRNWAFARAWLYRRLGGE
jgi:RNA polymerase sigma factor (TIGR02999 family)